jgi:hypothetical protein
MMMKRRKTKEIRKVESSVIRGWVGFIKKNWCVLPRRAGCVFDGTGSIETNKKQKKGNRSPPLPLPV